jgi:hypothetical protein
MKKIEHSIFSRLIGVWDTAGTILNEEKKSTLSGTDRYECILDGNYILHKANVKMGGVQSETFEMIELDNTTDQAKMYYYNSKGEKGVMTATINQDHFMITGDRIKFEGKLDSEDTQLIGKWYLLLKDDQWTEFIDLRLTKLKP